MYYRKYTIIYCRHPSIAQLVERWTVAEKSSIGRWFESGSKDGSFFSFFLFAFLVELHHGIEHQVCGQSSSGMRLLGWE